MDVFTSFDNLSIEPVADKPPSIVIMGGPCSSRVAVANRLLGHDVLPVPRDYVAWHTLQFIDTDCVNSFSGAKTAAVKTLWSWFSSVPLADVELDADQRNVQALKVVSVPGGSFKSGLMWTAPVVNILMSHPVLRAGSQIVICSDEDYSSVQFSVSDVVPIIIFVVSGDELSDQVCTAIVITSVSCVDSGCYASVLVN